MTCVLGSPWHPFNASFTWPPMSLETDYSSTVLERAHSQGYLSSGSDSRSRGGAPGKKRASRAGTRSVSTLSAAQLERKRANDREAQRAIRQRTKNHINGLERNINELRASQDATKKLAAVTHQKNRDLEEENIFLRTQLSGADSSLSIAAVDNRHPTELLPLPVQAHSPTTQTANSSIQRPSPASTPRTLSTAASRSSSSRHGSWQHNAIGNSIVNTTVNVPVGSSIAAAAQDFTTWRPHDGNYVLQSSVETLQGPVVPQAGTMYGVADPVDGLHWASNASSCPYIVHERQGFQAHQGPQSHQQLYDSSVRRQNPPQYVQPILQGGPTIPPSARVPHHHNYNESQLTAQTDFQNMTIANPNAFQIPQVHGYDQPAHYIPQIPISVSRGDYAASHGQVPSQMAPPPTTYQTAILDQTYEQQSHPSLRYQEEPGHRSCPLTLYPSA